MSSSLRHNISIMSWKRLPQVQCLLFVMQESRFDTTKSSSSCSEKNLKYFVLLPSIIVKNNLKLCELFTKNDVQLLSREIDKTLQSAVERDEVEIVELILENGPDTSVSESKASTRLQIFVDVNNENIVKQAFGTDAVIYTTKSDGGTLLNASDVKNENVVETLLSFRADIKLRDPKKGTLLHLAVIRDDESLIKLLLGHGANINAERSDGSTPLHLAVLNGNLKIVKLLLKNGAAVGARQKNGATSLYLAAERGFLPIYNFLLSNGASIAVGKSDGTTLFHIAAKNGHVEIFNDILKHGVDIDTPVTSGFMKGCTPVYLAAEKGHIEIVKRLLELGVDVNAESHEGQSVLRAAANKKCAETVKCILSYQPNLNCKSSKKAIEKLVLDDGEDAREILELLLQYGFTICAEDASNLILAVKAISCNNVEVVKQLLEHGLNVKEAFPDTSNLYYYGSGSGKCYGETSLLHIAARNSESSIIQLLIDSGADMNLKCQQQWSIITPLKVAVQRSNLETIQTLLANGATVNEDVCYSACRGGNLEILELLLNAVVLSVEKMTSIFHVTMHDGNFAAAKILLKFGADIDSPDRNIHIPGVGCCKNERTALHLNAICGHLSVVQFLIVNNANVNKKDKNGKTAIVFAAETGKRSIVDILLKFGASVNILDDHGRSVLHYCVAENEEVIFEALLNFFFCDCNLIDETKVWEAFSWDHFRKDYFMWSQYEVYKQCFEKCSKIFERHLIKMKAANLEFNDKRGNLSWRLSHAEDFQSDCEAEMARMKTLNIAGTDVTFYDILVKDVNQLAGYVRNDTIHQMLESKDYKNLFPIYASIIELQIKKGNERRKLLDEGLKICRRLFSHFMSLPFELGERIVNHLTNQNLAVLKYAFTGSMH